MVKNVLCKKKDVNDKDTNEITNNVNEVRGLSPGESLTLATAFLATILV
jgi:hypothetical protein